MSVYRQPSPPPYEVEQPQCKKITFSDIIYYVMLVAVHATALRVGWWIGDMLRDAGVFP